MIQCSSCGRTLDKVPDWLTTANVEFVCNNCPNRQAKNIAFMNLDVEPKAKSDDEDEVDVENVANADSD